MFGCVIKKLEIPFKILYLIVDEKLLNSITMKRVIILSALLLSATVGFAQISIPSSYYVNKAKRALEEEEAAKITQVVIIGTQNGILSYVVQDGVRVNYAPQAAPEEEKPVVDNLPVPYRLPDFTLKPVKEVPPPDEGLFANMLQKMLDDRWELVSAFGTKDGEVYVLTRKIKKEDIAKTKNQNKKNASRK